MVSFTTYWGVTGECGFGTVAGEACWCSLPHVWKESLGLPADTARGIVISRQLWVDRKWDNESPRLADSSDGLATPRDKGGPVTLKPLWCLRPAGKTREAPTGKIGKSESSLLLKSPWIFSSLNLLNSTTKPIINQGSHCLTCGRSTAQKGSLATIFLGQFPNTLIFSAGKPPLRVILEVKRVKHLRFYNSLWPAKAELYVARSTDTQCIFDIKTPWREGQVGENNVSKVLGGGYMCEETSPEDSNNEK